LTKKRVFELAKEYGLKGADLAKKLRELGFEQVRNQMSALDESELLMVQARMEIAGLIPETKTVSETAEERPLGIRRKPRPLSAAADVAPAPTPVEEPEAEESPTPVEISSAPDEAGEPAHVAPDVEMAAEPSGEIEEAEPVADETAPPLETVEADAGIELDAVPVEEPSPEVAPEIAAEAPAPEVVSPAPTAAPARGPLAEPRPTRAMPARPGAKIVGRIDPALLQSRPAGANRPAVAAGASDTMTTSGAAVDVRPTLAHNRKKALLRTDTASRDRLSTAQLKEREQSRVRRLTGPQRGGLSQHTSGRGRGGGPGAPAPSRERTGPIVVGAPVTVRALSEALGVRAGDLVKTMMMQFQRMVTPNSTLTEEDAKLLALEKGFEIEVQSAVTAEEAMRTERSAAEAAEDAASLVQRAPVIAFLGHVDHGKTSLIDAIRDASVAAGEAGGITQHIGAYRVQTKAGHPITILDTPGHQAFTEMRKRGAQATDIVVLVVAGDDGVMPQTEEAYAHAKAAGVQVIVALNKADKASEAQKERTVGQLAGLGLAPETWKGTSWGGHTAIIETSATKKTGIDDLLERVALEAEVLDLRANPERDADGIVIEAQKSGQKGVVATLLVQKGTLRRGDIILAGAGYGRVRNLYDDRGNGLEEAGPSLPVKVTGLDELPTAGDRFVIVEDLAQAAKVAEERARKLREIERAGAAREHVTLSNLFSRIKEGSTKEVRILLKADVTGSLEVLKKELDGLTAKDAAGNDVSVKVVYSAVGAITDNDVNLAATSDAIVVGFHVLAADAVKKLAQRDGVELRVYQVIYDIREDLRRAMEGLLSPIQKEVVSGHAEIRAVFRSSKFGNIAGCFVTDGSILRSSSLRLVREGKVIYTGKIDSLRRLKDDVREVKAGLECGIKVAGYDDIKESDVLEAFEIKEEKATLV